jgi:tryptophan-rich sensory protein
VSYISAARKVDRALIPYAAWFAFATIRNAEIAPLNPPEG